MKRPIVALGIASAVLALNTQAASATTWQEHTFQGWTTYDVPSDSLLYAQASITVPQVIQGPEQELSAWIMVQKPGQQIFTQVGWLWMTGWAQPHIFTWTNRLGNSGEIGQPGVTADIGPAISPGSTFNVAISNGRLGGWLDWVQVYSGAWQIMDMVQVPALSDTIEVNADLETYSATQAPDAIVSPVCFNWTVNGQPQTGGCKS